MSGRRPSQPPWLVIMAMIVGSVWAEERPAGPVRLSYDLSSDRVSMETQHYTSETRMYRHGGDGARSPATVLRLFVELTPVLKHGKRVEQAVCRLFTLQLPGRAPVAIPGLSGYRYEPKDGVDERNQVFGIDHGVFLTLRDDHGRAIQGVEAYLLYNTFIDFHAFCSMPLTRGKPEPSGRVPTLQHVGDRIEHFSSRSEPPVHLGSGIQEGSVYRNGHTTARFVGIGLTETQPCALVQWDNADASFEMRLAPSPQIRLLTKGHSHVEGLAWIDLTDRWVKRMEWSELIVSAMTKDGAPVVSGDVQMREGQVVSWPSDTFTQQLREAAEGLTPAKP